MRRTELVALQVANIMFVDQGARIMVQRPKTNQTGERREIAVLAGGSLGVLEALCEWLAVAGIDHSAVFRPITKNGEIHDMRLTNRSVVELVKCYAGRAGSTKRPSQDTPSARA